MEEGRGPRVPRSKGSKVQGSKGPRYLKLSFKYELDSKEGPSCYFMNIDIVMITFVEKKSHRIRGNSNIKIIVLVFKTAN